MELDKHVQVDNAFKIAQMYALIPKKDAMEILYRHALIIIVILVMNGEGTLIALMDAIQLQTHAMDAIPSAVEKHADNLMDVLAGVMFLAQVQINVR